MQSDAKAIAGLVNRLNYATLYDGGGEFSVLPDEAAAEIERLTAALSTTADRVAVLEAALEQVIRHYDGPASVSIARTALAPVDVPRLDG